MPKIIYFLIILFLLFLAYRLFSSPTSTPENITVNLKNTPFHLEVAKTISQKAKGLSNRSSLCPDCGMIFLFNSDGIQPFWMKDTLIPLDMIWVNSQGQIVSIQTANVEPPDTPITQFTIYKNDQPARYVIELNAQTSEKLGLGLNDTISLPSNL
jgi:uncharacterized membrane protein (UPF0127 family)